MKSDRLMIRCKFWFITFMFMIHFGIVWRQSWTSQRMLRMSNVPWQIILGSMDTTYFVLVSLAIWMEMNIMHTNESAGASPYVFLMLMFPAIDRRQKVLHKLFSVRMCLRWKHLLGMPMTMGACLEVTIFATMQLCMLGSVVGGWWKFRWQVYN